MTPREIEESVYDALEERRQRQLKAQQKEDIFKKNAPKRQGMEFSANIANLGKYNAGVLAAA